jgi:hypothetical protein
MATGQLSRVAVSVGPGQEGVLVSDRGASRGLAARQRARVGRQDSWCRAALASRAR